MGRLRSLPGVRAAETLVIETTHVLMSDKRLERIYEKSKRPLPHALRQIQRFYGHVRRMKF